jgi:hypothetical protein
MTVVGRGGSGRFVGLIRVPGSAAARLVRDDDVNASQVKVTASLVTSRDAAPGYGDERGGG